MASVSIEVIGTPIPQGSKVAYRVGDNRVVIAEAQGQALGLWRENVVRSAITQMHGAWRGPIEMRLEFLFARPRTHYGKRGLRPTAPKEKITKPDIDKLVRAVLDALTGIAFHDDAQVVQVNASKAYSTDGSWQGCYIHISQDEEYM